MQDSMLYTHKNSAPTQISRDVKAALQSSYVKQKPDPASPKVKVNQSSNLVHGSRETIRLAGLKRVGSTTPIGKIKEKIRRVADKVSQNNYDKPEENNDVLRRKINEANRIYRASGIKVTRKFMEAFPTTRGFSTCRAKLLYWISYINFEHEEKEWGRIAELFERARVNISSEKEQQDLQCFFESFERESNLIFDEERQLLDERFVLCLLKMRPYNKWH